MVVRAGIKLEGMVPVLGSNYYMSYTVLGAEPLAMPARLCLNETVIELILNCGLKYDQSWNRECRITGSEDSCWYCGSVECCLRGQSWVRNVCT